MGLTGSQLWEGGFGKGELLFKGLQFLQKKFKFEILNEILKCSLKNPTFRGVVKKNWYRGGDCLIGGLNSLQI